MAARDKARSPCPKLASLTLTTAALKSPFRAKQRTIDELLRLGRSGQESKDIDGWLTSAPIVEGWEYDTVLGEEDIETSPICDWYESLVDKTTGENLLHVTAANGLLQPLLIMMASRIDVKTNKYETRLKNMFLAQDLLGNTPLHTAAIHGQLEMVQSLLAAYGLAPIQQDHPGYLDATMEYFQDEPYRAAKRVLWNVKNNAGRTAVEEAIWNGHPEIVQWMRIVAGVQKLETSDEGAPSFWELGEVA